MKLENLQVGKKETLTSLAQTDILASIMRASGQSQEQLTENIPKILDPDKPKNNTKKAQNKLKVIKRGGEVWESLKQLPYCPERLRSMPNDLIRSPLFGIVKKGTALVFSKPTKIASWGTSEIYLRGFQFSQFDLDVYLTALYMSRKSDLNTKVYFTLREFLKLMGKSSGTKNMERLKDSLSRLQVNGINVVTGSEHRYNYTGSLILKYTEDKDTGEYFIKLDPDLRKLFETETTWIDWQTRKELKGDLTKWLHSFVCSHESSAEHPTKISLEKIQELCGSQSNCFKQFKQDIKKSFEQLKARGVIASYMFEGLNILFVRSPKQIVLS